MSYLLKLARRMFASGRGSINAMVSNCLGSTHNVCSYKYRVAVSRNYMASENHRYQVAKRIGHFEFAWIGFTFLGLEPASISRCLGNVLYKQT